MKVLLFSLLSAIAGIAIYASRLDAVTHHWSEKAWSGDTNGRITL